MAFLDKEINEGLAYLCAGNGRGFHVHSETFEGYRPLGNRGPYDLELYQGRWVGAETAGCILQMNQKLTPQRSSCIFSRIYYNGEDGIDAADQSYPGDRASDIHPKSNLIASMIVRACLWSKNWGF